MDIDEIHALAAQLGSLKPELRAQALARLSAEPTVLDAAVAAALAALRAGLDAAATDVPPDLDQAFLAVGTLAATRADASDALRAAVTHPSPAVRALLAAWGRGPAMPAILAALLDDEDEAVRTTARRKIGEAPDPGVVQKLQTLAQGASPAERGEWLEVLGACAARSERADEVVAYLFEEARGALPAAAGALTGVLRMGAAAAHHADALRAIAAEAEPRRRLRARAALVAVGVDVRVSSTALVDALCSADEVEHATAATAMRELPPALELAALEGGLLRLSGVERARALGRVTSQNPLMPLFPLGRVLPFLHDPSPAVRAVAIDAVARYVGRRRGGEPLAALTPEIRDAVAAFANDPDAKVREAVTRARNKLG